MLMTKSFPHASLTFEAHTKSLFGLFVQGQQATTVAPVRNLAGESQERATAPRGQL